MKVVIALGGSIMVPNEIDGKYISRFVSFVKKMCKKHELVVVAGGGRTARGYIEVARTLGCSEEECDEVGVDATRANARLLMMAMKGFANTEVPKTVAEAKRLVGVGKVAIMGGTTPKHSTDGVAALVTEAIGADLLIKATNVDGVYDKDPREHSDAKMFEKIGIGEVRGMVKGESQDAGRYALLDMLAVEVIERSKLKVAFLNGRDLDNMSNAIEGKEFRGTIIES